MIAGHALDAYCTGGSSPPVRGYLINGYTFRLTEAEADKVGILGQHLTDICQSGRHDRLVVGVAQNGQCRGCSREADERYDASKKGRARQARYEENHVRARGFDGNTMAVFRRTPEVETALAEIEAKKAEYKARQREETVAFSEALANGGTPPDLGEGFFNYLLPTEVSP